MGWSDEIDGYFRKPPGPDTGTGPDTDTGSDKARDSELLQETVAALHALSVKVQELARDVDKLRRGTDGGSRDPAGAQTDLPAESPQA
ncbi:MAG: hypothetical protein V7605_246 [Acidimicrobiaceae bacterium]